MELLALEQVFAAAIGLGLGIALGRWWGRHAHPNTLVADPGEAAEMRSEAAASVAARTERRLQRIMARAEEQGRVVNDDVEDMFCITDGTARAYLKRLVRLGRLHREGVGGGTYYVPTHTTQQKSPKKTKKRVVKKPATKAPKS